MGSEMGERLGQMTHDELIMRAVRWLKGTRKCRVVVSEIASAHFEIPDAIGWNSLYSVMIECKTSHSDFLRDCKKLSRLFPDCGVGNYRYYMTEPSIISPDELPAGWGLLEVYPKTVRRIIEAERFTGHSIAHRERPILVSLAARGI